MQKKIFNCSTIIFLYIMFLSPGNSFAQLSGTKTIPGDYATVEAAIAALNLQGVGPGGVTFNVAAGHTETFTSPTAGLISATGILADKIIFQKSGTGANPLITAALNGTTTNVDGIIKITGGDYIIFDGINLQENSGNTDPTTQMEWGYALVKRNATAPVDGCWYVTIKNSNITLNKANSNSAGIYSGNHLANSTTSLTLASPSDVMANCKFYSNTISNVSWGFKINGSTNASFYDQNNEIGVDGGNSISNYGGSTTSAYGMEVQYQDILKIANNTVNGGGASHTGSLYGIRLGSGNNSNVDIYGNTVTLTQGGTSIVYGIVNSMGSSGTNNTINIYNNIVENCVYTSSSSNSVWLIYNLASCNTLNIYGNILRNNSKSAGSGPIHCIYNSPTTATVNANIYNNEIYNNSSAGPMNGIHITAGTNNHIYGNKVYDIRTTSTTGSATSGILIPSGPINTYVYNNFISDLKADNSSDVNPVRGISITSSTANSNIGLYYNTIFLNASGGANFGSSGIFHTNSSTATTAALDMRNNIVVNLSTSNGTGKTVAFRRSAANVNLNNYSTISNNNCFYAGTPGVNNVIFFDGTNFDQTIEEFKTRVSPRETFSFTENVPFENVLTPPFDLHVKTNISTQTESGGTPITAPITVTNDYDGNTRNVTTPDVGADEFNGISIDITAPSIIYTILDPTTSTSNRTLSNVTITDQSGINVVPGTAPRIYFKRASDNNTYVDNFYITNGWKYTETINTSSPFEFLIDYSRLFGGTGVQSGDTIQYFVVAQDLASPANVGINSGDFNSLPVSVDLTAASFPITGTINSFTITILLNGTVTVGIGGDYQSLTGQYGLFKAINENILSGDLTALIIGDPSESGANALNQWVEQGVGNYFLTIQAGGPSERIIYGSYSGGLIGLNGADRVIIDGRFNNSGNYLTFRNDNAASNSATFQLISLGAGQGCSDITIRNCNIKAGSNSATNVFGIFGGSSTGSLSTSNTGGADFDNISIIENNISKCREGIFIRGTSSDQMQNLDISGNKIGSNIISEYVTEYGMYLGYVNAPQVTNNEIYNMFFDVSKWPIYFVANVDNAVVSKNKIHSIKQPGTTGYNSTGIYFSSGTNCFDNQIDNNMIYDLSTYGNTSMYLYGIRIVGGTNYKIYYNSISITDTIGNTAANLPSACLYISAASTNMDIRNNIFLNTRVGNSPKNYAVYTPNTTTFQFIDYNDYWTTGSVIGYFGADIDSLNDWRTATGQDVNSISDDPHYLGITDLHVDPSFSTVCDIGTPIAAVTTDIDGDIRNLTTPDIGADEYTCGVTTISLEITVTQGWNMVSVPGLHPVDQNVATWWPHKTGTVWGFNGTQYVAKTITTPGEGYWMKNIIAETYYYPVIYIVPHNLIPVTLGWNMIGGYETSPSVANLKLANPQITGTVWGFNGVQYVAASNIVPGYSYWVKVTSAGNITIPDAISKGEEVVEIFKEDWGRITVTDAAGISTTLYAVKGEVDLNHYELPPLPPEGSFDIRFSSGRIAEDLNSAIQTIDMSGIAYPLTVRVEGMDIRLQDATGKAINVNLKTGEDIVISDATINKLMVSGELIPAAYALEQNYPNPFNPSTIIEFSLPENVSNVKLSIYNALGEKVAELVNTSLVAGKYSYQWNARDVATGMYIYELRTDKFVSVKKMLIIK